MKDRIEVRPVKGLILVTALALTIVLGSVAVGAKSRVLSEAEMSATIGLGGCPGCEIAQSDDCNQPDECVACNEKHAAEPPVACGNQGKDYVGATRNVCKPNPPQNNQFCDEGNNNFTCYDVVNCNQGALVVNARCKGGVGGQCEPPGTSIGFNCKDCSNGSDAGFDPVTRDEDACVACD